MKESGLKKIIARALAEDIGAGDITTRTLIPSDQKVTAFIIAKQTGVIAGLPLVRLIYRQLDKKVRVKYLAREGARVKRGRRIVRLVGPARSILTGERVVLNFLQRLSGVATLTDKFVSRIKKYGVKILDTRKTVPGWRLLDKYAVKAGGGINHRMGLADAVLIKNNHLAILNGICRCGSDPITCALRKTDKLRRRRRIEIEVRTLSEFKRALNLKPDIVMLDNMNVKNIRRAVLLCKKTRSPRSRLEVSGGVTLSNVARIARTGVDYISVGALTHSAPALDISLKI
ncbi:MAG: carboxylating nicotinate-nucleotide diphosphorylase [Planctomycetes bacterium]|nr:carboxylating nicotinate-nucleotide diphosphorylase [Planctomycetota bacterium]